MKSEQTDQNVIFDRMRKLIVGLKVLLKEYLGN